ncbi:uncharacterized protein LOC135702217 isoform X2 [Ochlerotatus camptorhynchus]|uniref:uncharacterized protein LOC135702217 isoform X2 n=1 Tax=Ochlerotatus camptorhynchus TaxID=644619 RepID=UPI0031E1F5C5
MFKSTVSSRVSHIYAFSFCFTVLVVGASLASVRSDSAANTTVVESRIYRDGVCSRVSPVLENRIGFGDYAMQGEWPWHGAMFVVEDYKCGCSLISEWFVLTAGHCVFNPETNYKFDLKRLRVVLGLLTLNEYQSHTREHKVKEIRVHPMFETGNHKHDIALLLLATAVEFNQQIHPIEVDFSKPPWIEKVAGNLGTVVGWGLTDADKVSNELMVAEMPIVRYAECIESDPHLFGLLVHGGMYCAGARNGTSVCNGDSGGGMYIFQNNGWILRGVVSFAAIRDGTNLCNLYSYAAFTNVPYYTEWIQSQMQEHQRKLTDSMPEQNNITADPDTKPRSSIKETTTATATIQESDPFTPQPIKIPPSECLQHYDETITVEYGSSISLLCRHSFNGQEQSVHWFREDRYLRLLNLSNEVDFAGSVVHDILTLRHVEASHSGRYFCRVQLPNENVTDNRVISVVGVVPRFEPKADKPAYMKFVNYLMQGYFSLEVTFKADREDGVLFYRSDEWGQEMMMLALVNCSLEFNLLTNKDAVRRVDSGAETVKLGQWHTVEIHCHLGRCYFALDDRIQAMFEENLFVSNSTIENFYLGGIPHRNGSGFTGCISQMVLNDNRFYLRKEAVETQLVSQCDHCMVNPCQNGGVCVEMMASSGFHCMCPDGFTGRTCSNRGERCTALACVESICRDFENGFRCACSPERTGKHCQETNVLSGDAISFRYFGYAKYVINIETNFNIHIQFSFRNLGDGMIVAHILEDNSGSGNFLALVIDRGMIELRFSLDLDVNVSILKSSVPLHPNSWYTAAAGYQKGSVYFQLNDEPTLTESISKNLFSHHRDHFLYLGGLDDSVPQYRIPGKFSDKATDFDGCLKELKISNQTIDVTKSFLYARNVENCK